MNQTYAPLFRDYFRSDPISARLYEQVKRRLSEDFPPDSCYHIRDPACDLIMRAGERWRLETAWQLGPSDE